MGTRSLSYVYIPARGIGGTLYIGMTNDSSFVVCMNIA